MYLLLDRVIQALSLFAVAQSGTESFSDVFTRMDEKQRKQCRVQ